MGGSSAPLDDLQAKVQNAAEAFARETTGGSGVLGVATQFMPTGETVFVNADEIFPTASVIKVAIVSELFAQAEAGKLDPQTLVTVQPGDVTAGSGILGTLTMPLVLPLADLAMLTISVSDNSASNLCLRAVGGPSVVNVRMKNEWGMTKTVIHRPIKFNLTPSDPPHTATGTPRDMLHLLTLLYKGQMHSRAASDAVLRLMEQCRDSDLLPRYLDVNPYAAALRNPRPPFVIFHKTGAVSGVRNDAALVTRGNAADEEALAVCVYSKGSGDNRWTPANRGSEALAQIGKLLTDHFFA